MLNKKTIIALVLLITTVAYLPTLWNQYNIDDEFFTKNKNVTDAGWQGIPRILNSGYTFGDIEYSYGYRPISLITYNITYNLFGENVMLHHFINLILYLVLISIFINIIFYFVEDSKYVLLISLLFAVHPLHTEVVANLKSRDILLAYLCLMIMLRLILYLVGTPKIERRILYVIGILLVQALSFICHPVAILFVPVILLFYYFTDDSTTIRKKLLYIFTFGFASAFVLWLLNAGIDASVPMSIQTERFINENPFYYNKFPLERYLSSLYWWAYTIWISFIPWKLCHFYGFGALDVFSELSLFQKIGTIFTLSILFYGLFRFVVLSFKAISKQKRLLAFSFFVFFLFSFAQSNIYRLMPGIIAERWIFMNALFPILWILYYLKKYISSQYLIWILSGIWVVAWSIQTNMRCLDWYDRARIEAVDLKNFPRNVKLLLNEGTSYLEKYKQNLSNKSHYQKSKASYLKAVEILPQYAEAYNNIGVLEQYNMQVDSAMKYYQLSIKADSNYFLSTNNLAMLYGSRGDTLGLLNLYKDYIDKNRDSYEGYNSLILSLINLKRLDEALQWIEYGLKNCPHKTLNFLDLKGGVLWDQGKKAEALEAWQSALKLDPDSQILQQKIYRGKQLM